MEKNGAVTSDTPSCGCNRGQCKKASDGNTVVYPIDKQQADSLEMDTTKKLVDVVKSTSANG